MSDIFCTTCDKSLEECMEVGASCGLAARAAQRAYEADQRKIRLFGEERRKVREHVAACFIHWSKMDPDVQGLREGHVDEIMYVFDQAWRHLNETQISETKEQEAKP